MSSPLSNLKNKKHVPFNTGTRPAPFKPCRHLEGDLVEQILTNEISKQKFSGSKNSVTNGDLMKSMMTRLAACEKQLTISEEHIKEKDKRIKVLEEKCQIYKKSQSYGDSQVVELEKKCHKLQNQIYNMERFLEDYGMIWIGTNNSSDDEDEDDDDNGHTHDKAVSGDCEELWKPQSSITGEYQNKEFNIDYELVLKNIEDLNEIAGEGQHFIKYTKDGAKLEVIDPVPLTLFQNGIFMLGGPFRSFEEKTTQICIQDLMDGYFPSELQNTFPDGVPFRVIDKRDVVYRDKRMEKLFPGQGYSLSPEKSRQVEMLNDDDDLHLQTKRSTDVKYETATSNGNSCTDTFLSKLPPSVIRNGKIIDIRDGVKDVMQDQTTSKHNVIVIETDVVKEMKERLTTGRRSRPQTPGAITTLRIKSETGDQTYVLKMLCTQTIGDVTKYLDKARFTDDLVMYDLKTSFPNETYTDMKKTLRECDLTPNATLRMVARKQT